MTGIPQYDTLLRILIPSSKMSLKPLVMHYAWRADLRRSRNDETEEDEDKASNSDKVDKCGEVEPHSEVIPIAQYTLESIVESLPYSPDLLFINFALLCDDFTIISLFTNYDLHKALSDNVREAPRVELGKMEKLKWYMDLNQVMWTQYGCHVILSVFP
ncbi:hypothetical protein AcW1_003095 [Taiwanofungus camphoratus]|nr:hypothetical protein AcW1_003095 [Antrodia cinnamomea]